MTDSQSTSPVDSLDGDNQPKGVIKVENKLLLSELTANSPAPASTAPYRINKDYADQTDMCDYQYVNSDYDEEVEESTSVTRELSAPTQSRSPQISNNNSNQNTESIDKFVPPLALTDSLIADDPKTDGLKAVDDSLDLSMTDEDFARLENLMNNNQHLANPFNGLSSTVNGQAHTPTTMNDLKLPLGLVQSATPRPNYSQNELGPSVTSSYAEDDVTPRVHENSNVQQQVHFQDQQTNYASTGQQHQPLPPQTMNIHPMQQQVQYQPQQSQYMHQYQTQQLQNVTPQYQSQQPPFVQQQYQNQQPQFLQQQYQNHQQSSGQPSLSVQQQYQNQQLQYVQPQYQGQQGQYVQSQYSQVQLQQPYQNMQYMPVQGLQQQMLPTPGYNTAPNPQETPAQFNQAPYDQQMQQPMISGRQLPPAQLSPRQLLPSSRQTNPLTSPKSVKSSARCEEKPSAKVVGTVAPKPERPDKDFIERNINRARGVSSAKSGYANKLLQSKQQQEERKQWAPGMVVPRKKAASADNALRAPNPQTQTYEEPNPPLQDSFQRQPVTQNVWEQRASQLSQIKSRPTDKRRNTTVSVGHSKTETSRSTITAHDSITESRVKFDVNLEPTRQVVASNAQMRLIGPIPQNNDKKVRETAYGPPGANIHDSSSASVPKYHSPEQGYLNSPTHRTQMTSNTTSVGHQLTGETDERAANGQHVELASNSSYSQLYQNSLHSYGDLESADGVYTESRWNPPSQKPTNFVSDENELTLEEIIAIEQEKLRQSSLSQSVKDSSRIDSTHSSRDLNPYQTVPPIHHQMSEESVDGGDTGNNSYSQIHKNIKEKEEKGVSYKKYTLNDYKKLNKEVKLGGLGPSSDPTVLKEKHELRQKQLQLAKQARETEAKKAKAKTTEGRKEERSAQPSGRQLAQEYSKTVPKPKVGPRAVAVTPDPSTTLRSARSLTKLNDVEQPQLTYRTNHSTLPAHLTSHKALQAHLIRGNKPVQVANDIGGGPFPHSFSSPVLTQDTGDNGNLDYLQTIELLHKRHLEEKRLIAGIRQKI